MSLLFRHGDVLVGAVETVPADAKEAAGLVLAYGELTGHAHQIAERDGRAKLLRTASETFLAVDPPGATLVHEEHAPIALPPGMYRVWRQREYVREGGQVQFRPVSD